MKQIIIGGTGNPLHVTATEYTPIHSANGTWSTAFGGQYVVVPVDGVIRDLRVELTEAPGSGKSYTIGVLRNGGISALVTTISDTNVTNSQNTDVNVSAGDLIAMRCVPSGTPDTTPDARWSFEFEPTASNTFVAMGGSTNALIVDGTREYNYITESTGAQWGTDIGIRRIVSPINATLVGLYVKLNGTPGASSNYVFSIYKNGSEEVTSRVTISDSEVEDSVTGLSIDIAPGNILAISVVATNTPTARDARWGLIFQPDVDGESAVFAKITSVDTSGTTYAYAYGASADNATELNRVQQLASSLVVPTLRDLYVTLSVAPGSGKSRTIAIRNDQGAGNSTVTISNTDVEAQDAVNSDVFGADDTVGLIFTSSGTPDASDAFVSSVMFIPPDLAIDVNDSASISESVNPNLINIVSVSDSVSLSEDISTLFITPISISDDITISENITIENSQLGDIDVSDIVTISESSPSGIVLSIDTNDSVTISENVEVKRVVPFGPDISESIVISEDVSIRRIGSGVRLFIRDNPFVDRTNAVVRNSLVIENIITRQVDRAKFTIRKFGDTHIYSPTVGQEIEIYNDGIKIFGGIIVKFTQRADDYKIVLFDIECEDYTRLLDRRLVVNTYTNQTIQQIIEDINNNFAQDFTINNVSGGSKVIAYIAFNYMPVSQALQRLADLINFDWFVDFDKDIHFFGKGSSPAPFSIIDTDGSYIFKSLRIRRDNSQLKNKVFIRGGEFLADTLTTEFISDGTQNVYALPYRYEELQTAVTGVIWEQGIDNVDVPSTKDYIWNNDEKFIRFRGDRIPSSPSSIKVSGQPFLPVRVVVQDQESIDQIVSVEGGSGEYEYLIIDNSINSREGARERAVAELESYKNTLSEGSFRTYNDGLEAGMTITINSDAHGISEDFMINKVTARMYTHEALQYDVSLVTTKTMGIIEFLQDLLSKSTEEIIINDNEVLDLVHSKSENISIGETVVTSKSHNPQSETVTVGEAVTEQDLNYLLEFVLGAFQPTNTKRVFILNGSFLGPDHVTNPNEPVAISDVITNITIV